MFEETAREAMERARMIRIQVLETVNAEQGQMSKIREEQVKLSQEERSKN